MANKSFEPIIPVEEDGLTIPEIGSWAEKKYRLVGDYCEIFITGMKNKWTNLIYIDLFAGSRFAGIRRTNKILMSNDWFITKFKS